MIKLLAYPLTLIYAFFFFLTLIVFHPIQWFAFNVLGYQAHKRVVICLQFWLMRCLNILGTRFTFNNPHKIDSNRPLIIVANHQSMYDISPLMWYMRKHHPKFISKKELGKGIPSVSYNLRHGGSVLIDRKKPIESIKAIENFAKRVEKNNWAAVIFPEGTRSRTGKPKPFKTKGLVTLMNHMPNALVVPVSINNSWKTLRYGKFPMGLGAHITFKVHQPIAVNSEEPIALVKQIEQTIIKDIHYDE
ncbi:1-acyl-sn-glycerol-3-phosphate acyltransferase [Flavobacteriaceae bacterium S0825]|uniref:lysophospholipid acyltransferase family protein n=1 Tax=Gaetbulibacter sp. S0825 TaxID=2720084 RepID=UPI0014304394|nr:lysophospholipid acyltransferase family protein [Gaetbulibacter sp. S0825]MCK0108361.1 1-acyl-sn-glycerol-3-phosphate acyltransferase [Flavobacteriaceae bacterium S0825]NIX63997.1 1-acyl-sn-glycerol-3-phosphate acyltransferase [Gaetbulibacter sp. S0825]